MAKNVWSSSIVKNLDFKRIIAEAKRIYFCEFISTQKMVSTNLEISKSVVFSVMIDWCDDDWFGKKLVFIEVACELFSLFGIIINYT